MKKIILFCLTLISVPSILPAEAITAWRVQGNSVILESSTNLANPSRGKSAVIAMAYEKSFFRCKPSLAFLSFEGSRLGTAIKKQSSNLKNIDTSLKITSPIVGTAYLAPEPGAKKFIEEGQKIKKGQTIIIIEAMKTMNHVPSTLDGVVSKVLVKDGEPVE